MSYRYNALDIIVAVGMCAIVTGALLFFVATTGTVLVTAPQAVSVEQFSGSPSPMVWLQPALGQAIVERALLQRQTDHITAAALSEWNQALQAHRRLQVFQHNPFEMVMQRAIVVPVDHAARVQAVMGRSIVNFTRRGIQNGALSANQYLSDFNRDMIGLTEAMGRRLDGEFSMTWQPLLGRWIVEAGREYMGLSAGVQEQLGSAIVHRAQAATSLEDNWAANQYQLGSLLAAVDRSGMIPERPVMLARAQATEKIPTMAYTGFVPSSEMPIGYVIAAVLALCSIFWGGLMLSAAGREARALAEANRNASRWVYRLAA